MEKCSIKFAIIAINYYYHYYYYYNNKNALITIYITIMQKKGTGANNIQRSPS